MKYNYEYTIKYQDVDDTRRLRLYALENYLLEVAGVCADELGFGIAALKERNMSWILTNLSLEMTEIPRPCEQIRIETWIEGNAHMLSIRDFRIYKKNAVCDRDENENENENENWELIGKAKSVWAVLELTKREVQNIFSDPMFDGCVDGEVLEIARAARLRALPEVDLEKADEVRYSNLDYNGHCNSCEYLKKMLDLKRVDLSQPIRLDITYSKEVYFGDQLTVACKTNEDGSTQYQIKNPAGEISSMAMIKNL